MNAQVTSNIQISFIQLVGSDLMKYDIAYAPTIIILLQLNRLQLSLDIVL